MIVVTGATGALNGATVDHLLATVPADEIAVAVRDVAQAGRFAELGVEVRRGDYAEPATLPAAFAGADQLLLVSSNDPHGDVVGLHRRAIGAAVAAGVGRILYTSHQGAALDTPFGPGRIHAETEQLLAESDVAWTSLRNGFYGHSLGWLAGPWRETGVIDVPVDGPVSWTAREDEAEAAAVILALHAGHPTHTGYAAQPTASAQPAASGQSDQSGPAGGEVRRTFDGPVTLTAGAAPTFADLAAIASEVAGREIRCVVSGEQEWLAASLAAGEPRAQFALGMYQAAHQGYFAGTDPLLADLLGRAPRTARDALAAQPTS